jgi:hypothetical protein
MNREVKGRSARVKWFSVVLVLATIVVIERGNCLAQPGQGKELAQFKITRYGDQIILPVKFKDKDYWFILDTGSSFTIFDASFKYDLGEIQGNARVKTPRNVVNAEVYSAPEAYLGSLNLKSCAGVLCLDVEKAGYVEGKKVSGLIGMNFLRKYMVHIDFDADTIEFIESVQGEQLRWGQSCDISYDASGLAHVKGTAFFDIPVDFMIDTGHSGTGSLEERVFQQILSQKKAKTIEATFKTMGGTIKEREARINDLSIGSLQYRDLIFSELDSSILGLEFLARHNVIFDFPNKRLYLEEGRDYRRRDERDMSGLRLAKSYDKTVVYSVEVASPADKAGLKAGDVIIMVGPKLASQYDIWVLRRDLMAMDKSKVNVTFERAGQRKEAALVLEQKL